MAYVLIRETKRARRTPLLACVSMVAGLGLLGGLLGGTAYGEAIAAGLSRFIVLLAPTLEGGHGPRPTEGVDRVIRIKADSRGHYYVKGSANGVPFEFMIDSGSTNIVFPRADAERLHVGPLRFDIGMSTANGRIQSAQITIHELTIGSFTMSDVPALVNGGELDEPLLGAGWLGLFRSIEIKNGVMTLHY
jgi:clan AA aspartic protease (TIGR02281 family)